MAQFNIQAYKAVGGTFFKQALRTSPLILLLALLFVSCAFRARGVNQDENGNRECSE